jgi:hypothetical protein
MQGCPTVLVGMAGAGGAAGAMGGAAAMGVPVPTAPPPTSSSSTKAELLGDGTIRTSAAGGRLPPVTLTQKGWPDLPAREAPNFQSAQPVDLPPGTKIFRVIDDNSNPSGSYWAPSLPADEGTWRSECAVKPGWNSDGKMAVCTVPPGGMKVWVGPASSQGSLPGGGTQFWMPPGTAAPDGIYASPWSAKGGS